MPRTARLVIPGLPHLIRQMASRDAKLFVSDLDRSRYLYLARNHAIQSDTTILAYCLLDTEVLFVVVPNQPDSLARFMRSLSMRHAQEMNRRHQAIGHLWRSRYYSTIVEQDSLQSAIGYVETAPLRNGTTKKPEEYLWSSAPFHALRRADATVATSSAVLGVQPSVWQFSLNHYPHTECRRFESNLTRGLPSGSIDFISKLEEQTGLPLRRRPRGRPRRLTTVDVNADNATASDIATGDIAPGEITKGENGSMCPH